MSNNRRGGETFIRPGTTPEFHGVDMFIRPSRSSFVGLPYRYARNAIYIM